MEADAAERKDFRERRLNQAFTLLDTNGSGTASRARIEEVFRELNHYKLGVSRINANRARLLFAALDTNREGVIGAADFRVWRANSAFMLAS